MTDQYYGREEEVDSPATELDNILAQGKAIEYIVSDTANDLGRFVELIEWLYPRQQDKRDMKFMNEAYEIANRLGVRVTQSDLASRAATAFAQKMFQSYGKLAGDMEEVCQELDKVEGDLVDMRHEVNRLDASYKETFTTAYKQVFTELHKGIKKTTGCQEWGLVYRLTDLLIGNTVPSDEQCALLSRLLETFVQPEQG